VERFVTALDIGAKGAFDGTTFTVIGIMRCRSGDGAQWDEYLLHAAERGFLWLVHSEQTWERVDVLDVWPVSEWGDAVKLDKSRYEQRETYTSTVTRVIGAFNWRVRTGDAVTVRDYAGHGRKLTSEANAHELVWSQAKPLPFRTIAEKFGLKMPAGSERKWLFSPLPLIFSFLLLLLNLPAYESFFPDGVMTLIGLVLLWIPEWIGRMATRGHAQATEGGSR
jgi:hypothetical protein